MIRSASTAAGRPVDQLPIVGFSFFGLCKLSNGTDVNAWLARQGWAFATDFVKIYGSEQDEPKRSAASGREASRRLGNGNRSTRVEPQRDGTGRTITSAHETIRVHPAARRSEEGLSHPSWQRGLLVSLPKRVGARRILRGGPREMASGLLLETQKERRPRFVLQFDGL
jgi:hypothetical protein